MHLVEALQKESVITVRETVAGKSLLYVPIQATYAMFIDVYDLAPH